jgi:hypothetical protein
MESYGGGTGHTDEPLSLPQRCRLTLKAAVLALLLLELSLGISAAQVASTSKAREHVYLLRGAFNVFSLGLDEIADNLRVQGINVTVHNYLVWSSLADEATADYKSGRVRTIVLAGHSSGATAVTSMAARLGERGSLACHLSARNPSDSRSLRLPSPLANIPGRICGTLPTSSPRTDLRHPPIVLVPVWELNGSQALMPLSRCVSRRDMSVKIMASNTEGSKQCRSAHFSRMA